MGVVRMYRCGYIIIITFPYSTCISFFGSSISLFILKMFFRSLLTYDTQGRVNFTTNAYIYIYELMHLKLQLLYRLATSI